MITKKRSSKNTKSFFKEKSNHLALRKNLRQKKTHKKRFNKRKSRKIKISIKKGGGNDAEIYIAKIKLINPQNKYADTFFRKYKTELESSSIDPMISYVIASMVPVKEPYFVKLCKFLKEYVKLEYKEMCMLFPHMVLIRPEKKQVMISENLKNNYMGIYYLTASPHLFGTDKEYLKKIPGLIEQTNSEYVIELSSRDSFNFNIGMEIETCIKSEIVEGKTLINAEDKQKMLNLKYFKVERDNSIQCKNKKGQNGSDPIHFYPVEFIYERQKPEEDPINEPEEIYYFKSDEYKNNEISVMAEIDLIEEMSSRYVDIVDDDDLDKKINKDLKMNCIPATCGLHYHVSCDSIRYGISGALFLLNLITIWFNKYQAKFLADLNYQLTIFGKSYSNAVVLHEPVEIAIKKYIEVLSKVIKKYKEGKLSTKNMDGKTRLVDGDVPIDYIVHMIISSLSKFSEKKLVKPFFHIIYDEKFIHIEFRGMHPKKINENTDKIIKNLQQLYTEAYDNMNMQISN